MANPGAHPGGQVSKKHPRKGAQRMATVLLIPLTFDDYAVGRDPVMAEVPSLLSTAAP